MSVTPRDILHREFRRTFRGYHDVEVQEFLRQVAGDYEKLVGDNVRMKEEIENLRQKLGHYERIEATMQNALVVAQKTAEETKHAAEKRAELIIADAEQRSRERIDAARGEAAQLEAQMSDLRQQRRRFELQFKALLDMYREMLDGRSEEVETPSPPTDRAPVVAPQPTSLIPEPPLRPQPVDDLTAPDAGNGNGHGQVADDEITSPRHRLIDWHLVGAHVESPDG